MRYIEFTGMPLGVNAMQNIGTGRNQLYKNMPGGFDLENFKAYLASHHAGEDLSLTITPVSNGETVAVEMSDGDNTLFAVAFTSSGVVFSNQVLLSVNSQYVIITKNNFKTGIEITIV